MDCDDLQPAAGHSVPRVWALKPAQAELRYKRDTPHAIARAQRRGVVPPLLHVPGAVHGSGAWCGGSGVGVGSGLAAVEESVGCASLCGACAPVLLKCCRAAYAVMMI